jgi:hypothetical protein
MKIINNYYKKEKICYNFYDENLTMFIGRINNVIIKGKSGSIQGRHFYN